MSVRFFVKLAGIALAVLLAISVAGCNSPPPPELTGPWAGEAEIIVTWCEQDRLGLELRIAEDGSVGGRVGDAKLLGGRLRRNRGWLGRSLGIKTDYIIAGKLEGSLVAAEGIVREGVKIPCDFDGQRLICGLHSTGSHRGGKYTMVLSATNLLLDRPDAPSLAEAGEGG